MNPFPYPNIRQTDRQHRRLWLTVVVPLLTIAVRLPGLFAPGFPADQAQFVLWAYDSQMSGMAGIYRPLPSGGYSCNYPPGYLYALRGLAAVQNSLAPADARLTRNTASEVYRGISSPATQWAIALHKMPAILADALTAALLLSCLWQLGQSLAIVVCLAYSVNPAVWYDSAVWGQVDAIPTLLMLLSVELARRKRFTMMAIMASLAMLTKAQSIVLLPVWLAGAWQTVLMDKRRAAAMLAGIALTCVIVVWSFRGAMDAVWSAYSGAASYYPYTHLNGFSAWFLGAPLDTPRLAEGLSKWYVRDDGAGFLSLTPRNWGMIGVLTMWVVVTRELVKRRSEVAVLRWAVMILPLGFFVMSTQMHERYLFPAVALWAWAAAPQRGWWIGWIVLSLCAAFNQMWSWPGPKTSAWSHSLEQLLHGTWMGKSPGFWCAAVLVLLLIACVYLRPVGRVTQGGHGVAPTGR